MVLLTGATVSGISSAGASIGVTAGVLSGLGTGAITSAVETYFTMARGGTVVVHGATTGGVTSAIFGAVAANGFAKTTGMATVAGKYTQKLKFSFRGG